MRKRRPDPVIRDEVDRPALVGADGGQKRLRALPEPLSWALARQAEPFRAVESQKPFVVEAQSVLTKEIPQASISESGTFSSHARRWLLRNSVIMTLAAFRFTAGVTIFFRAPP